MIDHAQFSQSLRKWINTFVHRSMHDSARFVKASGISMPQFLMLMHLHQREHCGISDLSEHMDTSTAAVSQLVDKLVQADLLLRSEDPNDRRAKKVELSSNGKTLIEEGIEERYRWVNDLADALSDEEAKKVAEALEILGSAIKRIESEK